MTPRKKRALEISAREAELHKQRVAFERERSRLYQQTGQPQGKATWTEEEHTVRAELKGLEGERAELLDQVDAEQAKLRSQQAEFERARAAARAAGRKKPPASAKEQKVRDRLAVLQSERAHLDGTVQRDRDTARQDQAIWNTVLDATSWDSSYW